MEIGNPVMVASEHIYVKILKFLDSLLQTRILFRGNNMHTLNMKLRLITIDTSSQLLYLKY